MGQAQGHGGRAILGNGGGAARHSRVVGLLHAEGLVGMLAVLAVGGGQYEAPGNHIRLPAWWQRAVALLAGSVAVQT